MRSFLKNQKVVAGMETEREFMGKQPSEGLFRKGVMRNSQNSKEIVCVGISFLIKLNSVDLQLHEKRVFICTTLSRKSKLLKMTVQVKEHV